MTRPTISQESASVSLPFIAYGMNVHPTKGIPAMRRAIQEFTVPVARKAFGKVPAGIELHLDRSAERELRRPGATEAFGDFLSSRGLVPFSVNAFPLREFHAPRVKEKVYRPSWARPTRARLTLGIARILASLLPPGVDGSVSTLAGGYRPDGHSTRVLEAMARNYVLVAEGLERLEDTSGKEVVLAIEPEPGTTVETAADMVRFFEDYLCPAARARWKATGRRPSRGETACRRYLTVNFDTCHFSVLFEDMRESLDVLERGGVRVGKVHVTSALSARNPARTPEAYEALRGMDEPKYFHQFAAADASGRIRLRGMDLGELPKKPEDPIWKAITEVRAHYHVPISRARWGVLHTTREETRRAVEEVLRRGSCRHLVAETYTWPLLGAAGSLIDGIAAELDWLLALVHAETGKGSPLASGPLDR